MKLPFVVALLASALTLAVVGCLFELLFFRPVLRRSVREESTMLLSAGTAMMVESLVLIYFNFAIPIPFTITHKTINYIPKMGMKGGFAPKNSDAIPAMLQRYRIIYKRLYPIYGDMHFFWSLGCRPVIEDRKSVV